MSASEPQRRSALVLYGSETGNAQDVAEEIGALAERLHFTTHVSELNHVKAVCFPSSAKDALLGCANEYFGRGLGHAQLSHGCHIRCLYNGAG
jgi:sulfite reductase alpha subunit-like flavoprotein